jgi:MoaA/NifB/PqqE/SkfB family radical SAM enzyme
METNSVKYTFGWDLCYICNYRCPYCGVWNKYSKDNLFLNAEQWGGVWDRIYDKYGTCHIYVSGGEPSVYPNFYELISRLTRRHSVEICTNLSWDVEELVSKITPLILKISPTFHPTFADFEEFFSKIIKIKEYLPNSQMYYVAYPGQQIKDMPERSERLKAQGINLIPLPLRGAGFVLNSEEEKQIIEQVSPYRGEKIKYQLQEISPKGKLCRAGQQYAVIRANGIVDYCSQYQDGGRGNILDINFKLSSEPLSCEKEYCPIESQWILNE